MKKTILLLFLLSSLSYVNAQRDSTKVKFDLAVRYRFESWNGMNAKNYGDNSSNAIGKLNDKILYQRIITGITWKPSAKIVISAHLQDSRAFGWSLRNSEYPDLFKIHKSGTSEPYYVMNPNEEFFEIYDASIEYKQLFKNFYAKLGRQKLFYGDNHIFGPGEWGNTGRWTWDALKLSYRKGENFIDVFAGGTKIHDPEQISIPFTNTEFWGGGMYSHLNIPHIMNIEPFYAYKSEGSADYINTLEISRNWAGIRIFNNDFHRIVFDGTAVREFGNESGRTINAYGYFAKIGYQFSSIFSKPIISLRESYATGGKKSDAIIHTFDPAYGANDKYYGWMNITSWSNLDDREIVLELFPVKEMWVEMKYNWFYIPVPDDATLLNTMKLESGKHHLGNELDLFIKYQVQKHFQVTAAIGYFKPCDLVPINNLPAKNASWAALQLLFTL